MKNIFEQTQTIEKLKKEMENTKITAETNPFVTKKEQDFSPVYSEKTQQLLNGFKNYESTQNKNELPRAIKTIGKESQRRGKGRGCI